MMNRVELVGKVTGQLDLRYLPSGTAVCEFTLAVPEPRWSRDKGDYVETVWIRVQAWKGLAEQIVEENPSKGDPLYVLGKLVQVKSEKKDHPSTRVEAFVIQPLNPTPETALPPL